MKESHHTMNPNNLRSMSNDQLQETLKNLRLAQAQEAGRQARERTQQGTADRIATGGWTTRMSVASKSKPIKRKIAQLLTIMHERGIKAED